MYLSTTNNLFPASTKQYLKQFAINWFFAFLHRRCTKRNRKMTTSANTLGTLLFQLPFELDHDWFYLFLFATPKKIFIGLDLITIAPKAPGSTVSVERWNVAPLPLPASGFTETDTPILSNISENNHCAVSLFFWFYQKFCDSCSENWKIHSFDPWRFLDPLVQNKSRCYLSSKWTFKFRIDWCLMSTLPPMICCVWPKNLAFIEKYLKVPISFDPSRLGCTCFQI